MALCCKIEVDQNTIANKEAYDVPTHSNYTHPTALSTSIYPPHGAQGEGSRHRQGPVLVVGTLLARGRRTVTAALKQMGLHDEPDFSLFHQVLNRACWSSLTVSRLLLQVLVSTFVQAQA